MDCPVSEGPRKLAGGDNHRSPGLPRQLRPGGTPDRTTTAPVPVYHPAQGLPRGIPQHHIAPHNGPRRCWARQIGPLQTTKPTCGLRISEAHRLSRLASYAPGPLSEQQNHRNKSQAPLTGVHHVLDSLDGRCGSGPRDEEIDWLHQPSKQGAKVLRQGIRDFYFFPCVPPSPLKDLGESQTRHVSRNLPGGGKPPRAPALGDDQPRCLFTRHQRPAFDHQIILESPVAILHLLQVVAQTSPGSVQARLRKLDDSLRLGIKEHFMLLPVLPGGKATCLPQTQHKGRCIYLRELVQRMTGSGSSSG